MYQYPISIARAWVTAEYKENGQEFTEWEYKLCQIQGRGIRLDRI